MVVLGWFRFAVGLIAVVTNVLRRTRDLPERGCAPSKTRR